MKTDFLKAAEIYDSLGEYDVADFMFAQANEKMRRIAQQPQQNPNYIAPIAQGAKIGLGRQFPSNPAAISAIATPKNIKLQQTIIQQLKDLDLPVRDATVKELASHGANWKAALRGNLEKNGFGLKAAKIPLERGIAAQGTKLGDVALDAIKDIKSGKSLQDVWSAIQNNPAIANLPAETKASLQTEIARKAGWKGKIPGVGLIQDAQSRSAEQAGGAARNWFKPTNPKATSAPERIDSIKQYIQNEYEKSIEAKKPFSMKNEIDKLINIGGEHPADVSEALKTVNINGKAIPGTANAFDSLEPQIQDLAQKRMTPILQGAALDAAQSGGPTFGFADPAVKGLEKAKNTVGTWGKNIAHNVAESDTGQTIGNAAKNVGQWAKNTVLPSATRGSNQMVIRAGEGAAEKTGLKAAVKEAFEPALDAIKKKAIGPIKAAAAKFFTSPAVVNSMGAVGGYGATRMAYQLPEMIQQIWPNHFSETQMAWLQMALTQGSIVANLAKGPAGIPALIGSVAGQAVNITHDFKKTQKATGGAEDLANQTLQQSNNTYAQLAQKLQATLQQRLQQDPSFQQTPEYANLYKQMQIYQNNSNNTRQQHSTWGWAFGNPQNEQEQQNAYTPEQAYTNYQNAYKAYQQTPNNTNYKKVNEAYNWYKKISATPQTPATAPVANAYGETQPTTSKSNKFRFITAEGEAE